jgi:hypothetical protein
MSDSLKDDSVANNESNLSASFFYVFDCIENISDSFISARRIDAMWLAILVGFLTFILTPLILNINSPYFIQNPYSITVVMVIVSVASFILGLINYLFVKRSTLEPSYPGKNRLPN